MATSETKRADDQPIRPSRVPGGSCIDATVVGADRPEISSNMGHIRLRSGLNDFAGSSRRNGMLARDACGAAGGRRHRPNAKRVARWLRSRSPSRSQRLATQALTTAASSSRQTSVVAISAHSIDPPVLAAAADRVLVANRVGGPAMSDSVLATRQLRTSHRCDPLVQRSGCLLRA